jgi:hypothetical protein
MFSMGMAEGPVDKLYNLKYLEYIAKIANNRATSSNIDEISTHKSLGVRLAFERPLPINAITISVHITRGRRRLSYLLRTRL